MLACGYVNASTQAMLSLTRAALSLPARPVPVFGRVLDQTVGRQAEDSDHHWETGAGD
jgi:hypothetical protein